MNDLKVVCNKDLGKKCRVRNAEWRVKYQPDRDRIARVAYGRFGKSFRNRWVASLRSISLAATASVSSSHSGPSAFGLMAFRAQENEARAQGGPVAIHEWMIFAEIKQIGRRHFRYVRVRGPAAEAGLRCCYGSSSNAISLTPSEPPKRLMASA